MAGQIGEVGIPAQNRVRSRVKLHRQGNAGGHAPTPHPQLSQLVVPAQGRVLIHRIAIFYQYVLVSALCSAAVGVHSTGILILKWS